MVGLEQLLRDGDHLVVSSSAVSAGAVDEAASAWLHLTSPSPLPPGPFLIWPIDPTTYPLMLMLMSTDQGHCRHQEGHRSVQRGWRDPAAGARRVSHGGVQPNVEPAVDGRRGRGPRGAFLE